MVTLQGMHSTNCPQMPDVGVTPCGYPFSGQAQHQLPSNARCRGNPPWLPVFRAGTGACLYDLNARIFWADTGVRPYDTKFLVRRGNPLWLPFFRAGTGACPSAPITRFEGGHRGPPLRSRLLVCITCLHDRKPLLPFLAHSLSKFALGDLDI